MPESGFSRLFHQIVKLLETLRFPYLIVGGMATGILGEPRLTHDVDAIVDFQSSDIERILQKARESGFLFNDPGIRKDIQEKGAFRLQYQKSWADLIVASTELEQSAFKRARRVKVLDVEANFPSPEDFILFKLIPGRPKDLLDVESVILRQRNKLDQVYLDQWAKRISDDMEDLRLFNTLKKLLERR